MKKRMIFGSIVAVIAIAATIGIMKFLQYGRSGIELHDMLLYLKDNSSEEINDFGNYVNEEVDLSYLSGWYLIEGGQERTKELRETFENRKEDIQSKNLKYDDSIKFKEAMIDQIDDSLAILDVVDKYGFSSNEEDYVIGRTNSEFDEKVEKFNETTKYLTKLIDEGTKKTQ